MEPVPDHVIPIKMFDMFLTELFKDGNDDMYAEWVAGKTDMKDDTKLIEFEAAVRAGKSATDEFWRKWKADINKKREPALQ